MKIDADSGGGVGKLITSKLILFTITTESQVIAIHCSLFDHFFFNVIYVDWNEFMNYMLIENTTLSSMKAEVFEYQKTEGIKDPSPHDAKNAHSKIITCMIIIKP